MKNIIGILIIVFSFYHSNAQSRARVYTSFGNFTLVLEDTLAPITAGNFISLFNQKFYDDVFIHRVVPNFVIQGGDASRSGGTPPPAIQDEFNPILSNVEKTISMANAGPNTGTSQFFINLKDNTNLDYDKTPFTSAHPVFGAVIEGWDVVQTIGQQPNSGFPNNTATPLILMDSIRILPSTVGIKTYDINEDFVMFPNRANRFINLKSREFTRVRIQNLSGQSILEHTLEINANNLIDISAISEGVYLLELFNNEKRLSKKLMVNH